jgi:hypothetical protein
VSWGVGRPPVPDASMVVVRQDRTRDH